MATEITLWLDKLESAVDLDWERRKLDIWKRFLDFKPTKGGFRISTRDGGSQPGEWPKVLVNEAINDMGKMLLQQLAPVYNAACLRTLEIPNIRCNYGTGILASLFGPELFWMDSALDTLPTVKPFGDEAVIDKLLDAGVPSLQTGFGGKTFETAEFFKTAIAPYPKLCEVVWIYHPDLQGPVDIMELLWGSEMYVAFYSNPGKIKAFLDLITRTYIEYMKAWLRIVPEKDAVYFAHWARLLKGHIMLRDDSIVNLSPEMYAEFVKPYDERLLKEFGTGAIHSCGHIDHCVDIMTDSTVLTALNMSQPELNDMKKIHKATVGKGKILDCPYNDEKMKGLKLDKGVLLK
jgi:hypothetical protein